MLFNAVFLLLCYFASPLNDEGNALMAMKVSFSNVDNVFLDWDDVHNSGLCSRRGVFCDNATLVYDVRDVLMTRGDFSPYGSG
ncbi:hypothetical protein Pint_17532 [Pistacia integerrima]|uniref:Uncharacterized protein n=1 Tax=Pistacia integerrima TaxID=434235 RepID=A0ACC0YY78_9ROSI|nr:hypothetical protein Pint_17532 [Pistacia integerrima]